MLVQQKVLELSVHYLPACVEAVTFKGGPYSPFCIAAVITEGISLFHMELALPALSSLRGETKIGISQM